MFCKLRKKERKYIFVNKIFQLVALILVLSKYTRPYCESSEYKFNNRNISSFQTVLSTFRFSKESVESAK